MLIKTSLTPVKKNKFKFKDLVVSIFFFKTPSMSWEGVWQILTTEINGKGNGSGPLEKSYHINVDVHK